METTVLVKALRRVCLAQNSAAPDRRPARTGRPANPPGLRAILSDHRTILSDLCAILPDPRAILSDLRTILSDPPTILPDLRASLSDLWTILSDLCASLSDYPTILSDLCAILSERRGILSEHRTEPPGHPDLSPKHPYNQLNIKHI